MKVVDPDQYKSPFTFWELWWKLFQPCVWHIFYLPKNKVSNFFSLRKFSSKPYMWYACLYLHKSVETLIANLKSCFKPRTTIYMYVQNVLNQTVFKITLCLNISKIKQGGLLTKNSKNYTLYITDPHGNRNPISVDVCMWVGKVIQRKTVLKKSH